MKTNYWKRPIPDAIRGLTLERLGQQMDAFTNGRLADFALTADAMEHRDDVLKNVITKRKKAVTRHGWEILTENDSPEAREQREALDYFYRNLTCSHALRPDERGGFQLLVYQMMDAIGKSYAVHEIVWKPVLKELKEESHREPQRERERRGGPGFLNGKTYSSAASDSVSPRPGFLQNSISPLAPRPSHLPQDNSASFQNSFPSPLGGERVRVRGGSVPSAISAHSALLSNNRKDWLTADFRFVPLWFFEATTGPLRFLATPGALAGEPMAEGEWLVTVGDGLMLACARPFLFKHYPLRSWLDFSQQFGIPGVRGITSAARGTAEFSEMEETLETFLEELSAVTTTGESVDVIDLKGSGQPPFADLVERMDRVMASLWRGADLSTISRDRGYGATLQEQEARILEQDDARSISEHLNATIDRWVIAHLFGPSVPRLARIKILVTPQECTPHDLAIDQFLVAHGARLSLTETMERYGRVEARPDERALGKDEMRGAKGEKAHASGVERIPSHHPFEKSDSSPLDLRTSNLPTPNP